MKTIQAPNGKCYEVEDIWQPMSTLPENLRYCVLYTDGTIANSSMRHYGTPRNPLHIAWMPVPTVTEVQPPRWRAERREWYSYVDSRGSIVTTRDDHGWMDDKAYEIGNYFRTPEDAKSSLKFKTMNDPNSEAKP